MIGSPKSWSKRDMILSVTRKLIALVVIGIYLTLPNYCLAYALVKGESHNPYHCSETKNVNPPAHSDCNSHDDENSSAEKSHHDSHDEKDSDTCCVKLTKCLESTLPQATVVSRPNFISENLFVSVPQRFIDLNITTTLVSNHGPPGVTASQGFLSSSSSRAPPSAPSL
jgi:hypothetical protein